MKKILIPLSAAAIFWTLLTAVLLLRSKSREEENVFRIARHQARSMFQQVVDVRGWNASHGGVYVEVTGRTRPNPYLDVPDRDLETVTGKKLTLINPSYMTRQIAERGLAEHSAIIHLTSLKPIRPGNIPLPWEEAALRSFEGGEIEYAEFTGKSPDVRFRYMAPLEVEESCLACHGEQGYMVGDIRGAISITIPAEALAQSLAIRGRKDNVIAAVVWLVGIGGLAAVFSGFRRKQILLERLQELSLEDELTGLKNRRGFMALCAQEIKIARRWNRMGLLLFIDVDYLKHINDTFGHGEGDAALQGVAGCLRSVFRGSDVLARIGGDEFAVFCLGSSKADEETIISQLRDKLQKDKRLASRRYELSISVGTVEFDPARERSLEELISSADRIMYARKKSRPPVPPDPKIIQPPRGAVPSRN